MHTEQASSTGAGPWAVYGHQWAIQLLRKAAIPASLASGMRTGPNHAYLFLGAPQIGKTTLAREFARALLCDDAANRPCGKCRSCQLMQRGSHPDFRLYQPVTKQSEREPAKDAAVDRLNGKYYVDQADELIHDAALRPVEGRWRIFVLQDLQRATPHYFNKILKTLEEPPPQTILLLTALDRASVLPTIASRCQVLELRPLDEAATEAALAARWGATPEQARLLARLANGRLGWAVEHLREPERNQQRLEQLHTLWRLMAADRVDRLAFAETLSSGRNSRQLFGMLELWTGWWRDVLLAQLGSVGACSNVDQEAEILRQSQLLDRDSVRGFLHTLQRIEGYLHHTVNTRLALDVLMLHLPHITA
jgi:DNA polymerase III subunit delta'